MTARHTKSSDVCLKVSDFEITPFMGYDIEGDGFLDVITTIHSLCIGNTKGQVLSCCDQPGFPSIKDGLRVLAKAKVRMAHFGLSYDERAIQKIYPNYKPNPKHFPLDTVILSRLAFPDIRLKGPNTMAIEPRLRSRHSIEAWGARLNQPKDKYTEIRTAELIAQGVPEDEVDVWAEWSPTMQTYCDQDVRVLMKVFAYLWKRRPTWDVIKLEHYFAAIMLQQEEYGWRFDMDGALELKDKLEAELLQVERELLEEFGQWWAIKKGPNVRSDGTVWPKRTMRKKLKQFPDITMKRFSAKTGKPLKDYVGPPVETTTEGCPYTPIYRHTFNPGSPKDRVFALKSKFGWQPSAFTEKGAVKMDEEVLLGLIEEMPAAEKLIKYMMLTKRLGQLASGKNAWIKKAIYHEDTGEWRIHGRVNSLGTFTHRCTHSNPNVAQVPKASDKVPYGKECRALFIAPVGRLLVGSDADALELRILGHFLYPFDKGAFVKAVDEGNKETGTDPHSLFRDAVGTELVGAGPTGREKAKTLRYALLYGCGKEKAGRIIMGSGTEKQFIKMGGKVKANLAKRLIAEGELSDSIKSAAIMEGRVTALDGRILPVRKPHAALNTVLQCSGAVYMKKVLVLHKQMMEEAGYPMGDKWHYVGNIHDEFQSEVDPDILDVYKEITLKAYVIAGEQLNIRCPMKGSVDVGSSWADTH